MSPTLLDVHRALARLGVYACRVAAVEDGVDVLVTRSVRRTGALIQHHDNLLDVSLWRVGARPLGAFIWRNGTAGEAIVNDVGDDTVVALLAQVLAAANWLAA